MQAVATVLARVGIFLDQSAVVFSAKGRQEWADELRLLHLATEAAAGLILDRLPTPSHYAAFHEAYQQQLAMDAQPRRAPRQQESDTPRVDYQRYLDSPEWAARRHQALHDYGHRCQACGERGRLDVHHASYDRLGDEAPYDLVPLCRDCHGMVHEAERGDGLPLALATLWVLTHGPAAPEWTTPAVPVSWVLTTPAGQRLVYRTLAEARHEQRRRGGRVQDDRAPTEP
jgi:5-methylcytosine-specific restriction endonuclease McrA